MYLGNLKEETKKYFNILKLRRRADQKSAAAVAARRCQKIGGKRRMSAAAARRDRRRALVPSTVTQQTRWNSGFSAHWVCFMGGLIQRLGCVQVLLLLLL